MSRIQHLLEDVLTLEVYFKAFYITLYKNNRIYGKICVGIILLGIILSKICTSIIINCHTSWIQGELMIITVKAFSWSLLTISKLYPSSRFFSAMIDYLFCSFSGLICIDITISLCPLCSRSHKRVFNNLLLLYASL